MTITHLAELFTKAGSGTTKPEGNISASLLWISPHPWLLMSGTRNAHVNKTLELRAAFATEASESIDWIIMMESLSHSPNGKTSSRTSSQTLRGSTPWWIMGIVTETTWSMSLLMGGFWCTKRSTTNGDPSLQNPAGTVYATTMVYVHQKDVLKAYKQGVKELFRAIRQCLQLPFSLMQIFGTGTQSGHSVWMIKVIYRSLHSLKLFNLLEQIISLLPSASHQLLITLWINMWHMSASIRTRVYVRWYWAKWVWAWHIPTESASLQPTTMKCGLLIGSPDAPWIQVWHVLFKEVFLWNFLTVTDQ